ncbi:MAG: type IVB secretion system protein IcmJDotN [Alphaproteobacteria bacterium]|nr:type IVB secretion system protein IcmJDotN [Alphaproteobacteria bacterium]
MDMYPITLGIALEKRGAQDVVQAGNQADAGLTPAIRQKILERDDHTCRFCGFQSSKYQDVHFVDNDPTNLQMDNMITSCIYCHQCFDLEKVAEMNSGVLIWLPEIEQAELNHIARAIYVARISQGTMSETAKKTLEVLMSRREDVKQRIDTDDPYVLATVMKDFLGPRHYAMREKKLEGVRLFPLDRRIIKEGDLEFNQFPQILAYWRSKDGPFGGKVPSQWKNFYAELVASGQVA